MRLMRSAGYQSVAYSSVDEFVQSDFQHHDACIIADVHMPGTSALELPVLIQGIDSDLPVIFLSADYNADTRERIRKSGGHGYFGKPIDDNALIDMIRWTTSAH